ncbi:MAG: hypothetical protein QOJ68_3080 [Blastococcus sp.]|nr:hypothetical protein [Blastococcus sp.]
MTGARSAGAKAVTTKAATIKAAAAAKAAASTTVATRRAARTAAKAAPAKAAAPKAVPAKAAPAKTAAARTAPAKAVVAKPAPAKTAAAKAPTAKAPTAKAASPNAVVAKPVRAKAAPARRPTPYRRDVVEPAVDRETRVEALPSAPSVSTQGLLADAESVVAAVAARGFARRLVSSPRRRPPLYLAAALVAATSFGTVTADGPQAVAATPAGHSVSIAHELGIDRQSVAVTPADAQHLQQLAASRNRRSAEQVAAAQVQAAANARATEAAQPKAVLPVAGARLTSTFGMRWGMLHAGIDLAAPLGTPECAAMDGVVLRAGPASGFGLAVYIQHANGDVTVYGHMEKILVTEGQIVNAGETIALLGANGQATGPHLHLEVHVGGMMGTKIDPLPWLRARGVVV